MSNDSMIVMRCGCGEIYYAASQHAGSYVRCRCGEALLIIDSPAVNFAAEINAEPNFRGGKSAALNSFFLRNGARGVARIAFVVGLLMLVGYRLIPNPASREMAGANAAAASPSPAATITPLPGASHGFNYKEASDGVPLSSDEPERAPVSLANGANIAPPQGPRGKMSSIIINETERDAAVKLVESASGKTRRFVYVRANSRVTIRGIAGEECRLRFATGADWDGESRKFLSDAAYSEFETALNFRRANYSVKLKPSILGNVPVDSIDEEKFAGK